MPTPGWRITVDEVGRPDGEKRIPVRLTATGPEGPVIQVLTPASVHVPLGSLAPGDYLVDIRLRRGRGGHERVHALILRAR